MVDTFREFKVGTSNYSAEYGRMSSGILNTVLKSGSNRFHGMAFEYHRNKAFDARNFSDQEKSQLIQNQFGANLGGPVLRDRLFFFAAYEAERIREGEPHLDRVPTAKARQGDFSDFAYPLVDPLAQNQPFAGNRIPASRMHPAALRIQERMALPNLATPFGNYNFFNNKVVSQKIEHPLVKADWNVRAGTSVSARYGIGHPSTIDPYRGSSNLPGFEALLNNWKHTSGVNLVHPVNPTTVLQVLLGYNRTTAVTGPWKTGIDYGEALGIPGIPRDPDLLGFPQVTIRGYAKMADRDPTRSASNDYQANAIVTFIRGAHNIRAGAEMIRMQAFDLVAAQSRGLFNFNGRWTANTTDARRQEPYADFLLGVLNNSSRRVKTMTSYIFATYFGGFVQDDWKIGRNLTLNAGLRYELHLPPADKYGQWTNFDPATGGLVLSGDPAYPRALIATDRNNLAPRCGFAWRPRGSNSLAVRGGYGLFYAGTFIGPMQGALGQNPPYTVVETYQRAAAGAAAPTLSDPFPASRANVQAYTSPSGFERRPATSYMQNYNFMIERQLAPARNTA